MVGSPPLITIFSHLFSSRKTYLDFIKKWRCVYFRTMPRVIVSNVRRSIIDYQRYIWFAHNWELRSLINDQVTKIFTWCNSRREAIVSTVQWRIKSQYRVFGDTDMHWYAWNVHNWYCGNHKYDKRIYIAVCCRNLSMSNALYQYMHCPICATVHLLPHPPPSEDPPGPPRLRHYRSDQIGITSAKETL